MLKILPVFSVLMFLFMMQSCTQNVRRRSVSYDSVSGYTIIKDSFDIDLGAYINPACDMSVERVEKYHDRYYLIMDSYNYTNLSREEDHLVFRVSPEKGILKQEGTNSCVFNDFGPLYDFFTRNDTLFSRSFYYDDDGRHEGYYLDCQSNDWVKVDDIANECLNDDDYWISYDPRGEFGYYCRFEDKKTGAKYQYQAAANKLLKYDDSYYVISLVGVYRITDPRKGWQMDGTGFGRWYSLCPRPEVVLSTRYDDIWEYEYAEDHSQDTIFISGYIKNGELFLLMRNSEELFLSQYRKDAVPNIVKVLSLGNIRPYQPGELVLSSDWNQHGYLAKFDVDWCTEGIIDIEGDTIQLTYIRTEPDTLQYTGMEVLDKVLPFLSENLGNISMDQIAKFEKSIGGKTDGHISNSPRHSLNSDYELTSYFHAMDETDSFLIEYCYNKVTKKAEAVSVEFGLTNIMNGDSEIYRSYSKVGKMKSEKIKEMMIDFLGQPLDSTNHCKKGNLTYYVNSNNRRITIY